MSSSRQFSDEDDITGVDFIDQDYHQFTKRTYEIELFLDSGKHVWTDEYTLELYFSSASFDYSSVDISATRGIEKISRVSPKKSADHPRLLVDIHKCNNVTTSYLMMDLALKNMSGVAYAQDSVICVIVNGILEYHDDVPLSVG